MYLRQSNVFMKALILMSFNATSLTGAFQALERTTDRVIRKASDKPRAWRAFRKLKRKHPLIQNYLCSDQGVHLMSIDGAIAAKAVNHFTNKNEPVLCIHDSFICREQFKDELIQAMNEKTSDTLAGYIVGIKSNSFRT